MTCRRDRDVYLALSASSEEAEERTRGFRGGRSFVMSIFEHWKSPDGLFFGVFERCTVISSQWRGLLLYTWYFWKSLFDFVFRWRARNYESPWCLDKTNLVVWWGWQSLAALLPKLLDRFTVYLIRIYCTIVLSKSPEKPFWKFKP